MEPATSDRSPSREQRRQKQQRINELSRRLDTWGSEAERAIDGPPPGEWDSLLGLIIGLLTTGRPPEEIAARVSAHLREHYGLTEARDDVTFASELLRWWNETNVAPH
ncbi:MAG: hypothetical protein ACOH2F_11310 [Cellulomonas sp.]